FTLDTFQHRQVRHQQKCSRMLRAEQALLSLQNEAINRLRLRVLSLLEVKDGEILLDIQSFDMVGAENAPITLDNLSVQRLGVIELAFALIHRCQVVHPGKRVLMLGAVSANATVDDGGHKSLSIIISG